MENGGPARRVGPALCPEPTDGRIDSGRFDVASGGVASIEYGDSCYITSSRWPQKRQASVSNTSTSTAHRLAEPTHVLCKEAMFPLLADTARTCLATPEGKVRHRVIMQQTTSSRHLCTRHRPLPPTGIIAVKNRSTSCERYAKLLTPRRCVDWRWMGAMRLNREARRATFSNKLSPRWIRRLQFLYARGFIKQAVEETPVQSVPPRTHRSK